MVSEGDVNRVASGGDDLDCYSGGFRGDVPVWIQRPGPLEEPPFDKQQAEREERHDRPDGPIARQDFGSGRDCLLVKFNRADGYQS